jgi:D-sedoheptulose 7-phosphate isomerase
MKESVVEILKNTVERNPSLKEVEGDILSAFNIINESYANGGTLFVCGNGGSCSDSEHIVGELMKSFKKYRPIDSTVKANLIAMGEDGKSLAESLEGGLPAVAVNN